MISFSDLEDAFLFVSSEAPFTHSAVINKNTGTTYYQSDLSDFNDFPEDVESEEYLDIPHKQDLDLGTNLVFDFVSKFIPDKYDDVNRIFNNKGAYRRFKALLESLGKLEKWYDFENERTKLALLEWCKENNLIISDE